ncbi:BTAD domain-containing putative transcriptional regulator [Nocardia sp. NPDC060259]|uniref:AfsR/SARP family transcriptional regulator n=1 Tax=Nocardia sp. NPDC060259 TaxID=3347088 RepID=UPI00366A3B9F
MSTDRPTPVVENEIASTVESVRAAEADRSCLTLFGAFELEVAGARIILPMHARRVLVYLSLHKMAEKYCNRTTVAQQLWADSSLERSRASLRTALWRINRAGAGLVFCDKERVSVTDALQVDVHQFRSRAEQLLSGAIKCQPADIRLLQARPDLLSTWDEDWLVLFREQLRLLRLHALEIAARNLCVHEHHAQAIDAILPVIAEEPLRESAHAVLISAHLGLGNAAEARRCYDQFAANLWAELRLRPSADLMPGVVATWC